MAISQDTESKLNKKVKAGLVTVFVAASVVGGSMVVTKNDKGVVIEERKGHPLQTQELTYEEYLEYISLLNEGVKEGAFLYVEDMDDLVEKIHAQAKVNHQDKSFLKTKFR